MCDIGRFNYHWIEGDERLTRPLQKGKAITWEAAIAAAAGALKGNATRFLVTAHASNEELYVTARLAQHVLGDAAQHSIFVTWTSSAKSQPAKVKFQVPSVDAPNVAGAKAFGLTDAGPGVAAPDLSTLRNDVEGGRVSSLYVLDPGPAGSVGDVSWIIAAKQSGKLATLIVQGVLNTPLAQAADLVLPGACWIEKEASYTNAQGRLQAVSRVMPPPGEALEDAQILVRLAEALGAPLSGHSAAEIRQEIAQALPGEGALAGIEQLTFSKPVAARNWLQASNPSERWKWDFMFQDLPPVKFADQLERRPAKDIIPLTKVD
jgi:predicted molibdopterin-dependent oxidoreductase YjgC